MFRFVWVCLIFCNLIWLPLLYSDSCWYGKCCAKSQSTGSNYVNDDTFSMRFVYGCFFSLSLNNNDTMSTVAVRFSFRAVRSNFVAFDSNDVHSIHILAVVLSNATNSDVNAQIIFLSPYMTGCIVHPWRKKLWAFHCDNYCFM